MRLEYEGDAPGDTEKVPINVRIAKIQKQNTLTLERAEALIKKIRERLAEALGGGLEADLIIDPDCPTGRAYLLPHGWSRVGSSATLLLNGTSGERIVVPSLAFCLSMVADHIPTIPVARPVVTEAVVGRAGDDAVNGPGGK
jgi:hypothetical protein